MAMMLKLASAALLTVGLMACAGAGKSSSLPCASCKYGVSDKKADAPKHYCVIDGKAVDCKTAPAQCPECAANRS